MEIFRLRPDDEFIKLGQLLKAAGAAESGVDAKEMIQDGIVLVNGETETRRGRKLYAGDVASCDGREIKIEKEQE
jgi:ribosome-associated protein